MAEYISRDDALLHSEIIRVYSKDYGNIDVVPVEYLADIPAADVQPVNHWISVKDRLPENHKLVLCYAQSTTGEGCCYILGTLSNDEFWFLQAHDGHHLSFPNLHLVVTHWQPLPEPPVNL